MILVNVVQNYSALFGELCALCEKCRRKGSNPHSRREHDFESLDLQKI